MTAASKIIRRGFSGLLLGALLVLTFAARSHNSREIFHNEGIYFIDGDCYSRMTRAKLVTEGQWIISQHEFENWPQGVTPHTTAPLDWLIVSLKNMLDGCLLFTGESLLKKQTLDLAGALISPILGMLTVVWLWWWAGLLRLRYRAAMVLFFSISPILVHGTLLGRPDHQSLLIFTLAVALCSELAAMERRGRSWQILSGIAWGVSMWVSLYEPLILFICVIALRCVSGIAIFKELPRWIALAAVCAVALLVDGWRIQWPDPTLQNYFSVWAENIGELKTLSLTGKLIWFWFGLLWISAPILLGIRARIDRRAGGLFALILITLALSAWQLRWGYFAALILALSLPWMLEVFKQRWLGWTIAILSLLPLAGEWSRWLHPAPDVAVQRSELRASHAALRNIAVRLISKEKQPFLAPWWLCPEIAYWSGQPGIAGSSHQSLPGIVDTAHFFTANDPEIARSILQKRGVKWVIIHDEPYAEAQKSPDAPRRYPAVVGAAKLLGIPESENALGNTLAESPFGVPKFLKWIRPEQLGLVIQLGGASDSKGGMTLFTQQRYKLYEVVEGF